MPTPDLTGYSDLVLYDAQPADLVNRAVTDAAVKMPDWEPVDGNTEMVLIEAHSTVVAELVYAINRLPGGVLQTLQNLYGIFRDPGTKPAATVTFTVSDTLGHTIPAGTTVRLTLGDGSTVDFATDAPLAVAEGTTTGTVAATGTTYTASANGTAAGTALDVITAVQAVESAALGSDVTAGADPESDADWRDRTIERFKQLSEVLVLPRHFTAEALANALVARATTIDNYDPGTGPNPGDNAGHVTVAVLGSGGATLSAADKTALSDAIAAKTRADLALHIVDPTITTVDVDVTVEAVAGFDAATVEADIIAALDTYLSPDTWPWAGIARLYELVSVIDQVEGVDYVASITTPAADVALAGVAPLADLGTATVTVNMP